MENEAIVFTAASETWTAKDDSLPKVNEGVQKGILFTHRY
jgi:hypothetical protein